MVVQFRTVGHALPAGTAPIRTVVIVVGGLPSSLDGMRVVIVVGGLPSSLDGMRLVWTGLWVPILRGIVVVLAEVLDIVKDSVTLVAVVGGWLAGFLVVDSAYCIVENLGTFPTFKALLLVLLLVGSASESLPTGGATVLQLVVGDAARLHVMLSIARITEVFATRPTLRGAVSVGLRWRDEALSLIKKKGHTSE